MASPGLQTFCCLFSNSTGSRSHAEHHVNFKPQDVKIYNTVCVIFAAVSIFGASYQLWPKRFTLPRGKKEAESFLRQNAIICWLALADLFASIGILVRSALWIAGYIPLHDIETTGTVDFPHLFCAISSGWIQYFYICTYFWTFFYAFDTYLISQNKKSHTLVYHIISWVFTAVLTGAGLVPLYNPELLHCERYASHLLPHTLATYVPILVVMICNPIFYAKTANTVRLGLMKHGRYTDRERKIVRTVNEKFLLVILAFYLCWFPNILNGIMMLFRDKISSEFYMGLWQFMGVVNPVQAFLNTLVYRGSGGLRCRSRKDDTAGGKNHVQDSTTEESTEHSPLLSFRR